MEWLTHQTHDQLLELLALLKSLGDQVRLVELCEPPGIQLQDLLRRPFRQRRVTRRSKYQAQASAEACWQARICDLPGCLERTRLPGGETRFNLRLSDPLEASLDDGEPWRGIGGEYVVTLGPSSGAERGTDDSLPILTASVGAFTRLWLGVRPASGLAATDTLDAPPELLEALDELLRLPPPKMDWMY